MVNCVFPYTDEDMVYNYEDHRYILTKKYVREKMGIDIESREKFPGALNAFLNKASEICYDYIHEHNNSKIQDLIIARTKSGRNLIQVAMRSQIEDMLLNGIFDNSAKPTERELWICQGAKRKLDDTFIPEIGTVITYTGTLIYRDGSRAPW